MHNGAQLIHKRNTVGRWLQNPGWLSPTFGFTFFSQNRSSRNLGLKFRGGWTEKFRAENATGVGEQFRAEISRGVSRKNLDRKCDAGARIFRADPAAVQGRGRPLARFAFLALIFSTTPLRNFWPKLFAHPCRMFCPDFFGPTPFEISGRNFWKCGFGKRS